MQTRGTLEWAFQKEVDVSPPTTRRNPNVGYTKPQKSQTVTPFIAASLRKMTQLAKNSV